MKSLSRAFRILGAAISLLQYGKPIVPLALYFILKLGIILLYVESDAKTLVPFWRILKPGLDPENLSRYPHRLLLMSALLGRLDIPLEILLLSVVQGATVLLVASAARQESLNLGQSMRKAGARYVHLVVASALASAAIFVVFRYPGPLVDRFFVLPRGIEAALATLLGLAVQAFFLYAGPFILLEGRAAIAGVGRSFAFGWRHFPESFFIVLIPFILTVPTLALSLNPQVVAFQISPDLLVQIQVAEELMQFVTTYLLMGGSTIYFLETRATGEEH